MQGRGRSISTAGTPTRAITTIRLDSDVLAFFRVQGRGYQTHINEALRDVREGLTSGSTRTRLRRVGWFGWLGFIHIRQASGLEETACF